MDFVGPLPLDEGFDCVLTLTDRSGADVQLVPCRTDMDAKEIAGLFFNHWYCENGCPREIISDRDKIFMSKLWRGLMKMSGIKHKMSTAFHPETDGASERTNKTIIQCIRFHVDRDQKGWVKSLPKVRFHLMNTVNASTGYAPFVLKSGHHPRLIPPLIPGVAGAEPLDADALFQRIQISLADAQDSLTAAKISQAHCVNASRSPDPSFLVGDQVLLSTENRRRDYIQRKDGRAAKFMPRFDGPFIVKRAFPDSSLYTLEMPGTARVHPTFHVSLLRKFVSNNADLFPLRERSIPGPVLTDEGRTEFFIDRIVDERRRGRGKQYLVRWTGEGPEGDLWLPRSELVNAECLDKWESRART